MPNSAQVELNKSRNASSPLPIGYFWIISDLEREAIRAKIHGRNAEITDLMCRQVDCRCIRTTDGETVEGENPEVISPRILNVWDVRRKTKG